MNPLCRAEGVGLVPWSPLARGLLTGSRLPDITGQTTRAGSDALAEQMYRTANFEIVARVSRLAEQRGVKPAQIALAWLLHQPGVAAPVIGATKLAHLEEAVAAVDIELSPEECTFLEELYQPRAVFGHS